MEQDKILMNFEQYVTHAFEENKGTIQIKNQENEKNQVLSNTCIKILNLSQIQHKDMSIAIWLFRKCYCKQQIEGQQKLFIDYQFIIRHIILFLLMLIAKQKNGQLCRKELVILMKSVCVTIKKDQLKLHLELDNHNIAKLIETCFQKQSVVKLENVDENTFQVFLEFWQEIKEIKNSINKQLVLSSLQDLAQVNFLLNSSQGEIIRQKEKQLKHQNEIQRKEQALIKLNQSKLFNIREIKVKFCRVIYKPQHKELQLLPNGNIIYGQFWKQKKVILSLSQESKINYFFKSSPQLNNYLTSYNGFCQYIGPLNDYLEPDTKKQEILEGVLESVNKNTEQFRYKGSFKNGLFHGKGRMYKQNVLDYVGQFKNGLKNGKGYQWAQGDFFLYGFFEQNNKQGQFEWYRCINYQTKEKIWEKQMEQPLYYRNDLEFQTLTQSMSNYSNDQQPATILLNMSQYGINNFQLDSLRPGGWINSSVIDIFLQLVRNLKRCSLTQKEVVYVNCSEFQDIFGSILTKESQINKEPFEKLLVKVSNPRRIVFYFNLDRGHFLSVVWEDRKLYLLDSMTDSRECLLNQIKKLLNAFKIEFEDQWNTLDQSQQQNSYDCGIYTIFFISQLIKNEELTIQQMKEKKLFYIEQSSINQIRHNIYQILMANHSSIFKIHQ